MAQHDTDPDPVLTSAKKEPAPHHLVIPPAVQARINQMVVGLVVAILAAVWGKVDSCQAKDAAGAAENTASQAKQLGVTGAGLAREAKITTDAAYDETRDKVNPLGEDVRKLREDLNVLLQERTERLNRIKAKKGRRPEVVPPKPVSPEGGEPLPATPTAAPVVGAPATPGGL